MLSLWTTLYQINPKYFPKGPDVMIPQDEVIDQPKYRILYHTPEKSELKLLVESGIPNYTPIIFLRREFMVNIEWILCFIHVNLGLSDYVMLLNSELCTC